MSLPSAMDWQLAVLCTWRPLLLLLALAPVGAAQRGLAAGTSHGCSLQRGARTAVCWGWDSDGQVSKVPEGERFRSLAAGARHSCGIREADSTVRCWGSGMH